jgi:heparanase 1
MIKKIAFTLWLVLLGRVGPAAVAGPEAVAPDKMPRIAIVDERYQSHNIEMLEVTGGKFWKPYGQTALPSTGHAETTQATNNVPAGIVSRGRKFIAKPLNLEALVACIEANANLKGMPLLGE